MMIDEALCNHKQEGFPFDQYLNEMSIYNEKKTIKKIKNYLHYYNHHNHHHHYNYVSSNQIKSKERKVPYLRIKVLY